MKFSGWVLGVMLCAGIMGCTTPYKKVTPDEEASLVESFNGEYKVIPRGKNDFISAVSLSLAPRHGEIGVRIRQSKPTLYRLMECHIGNNAWHANLGEPESAIEEIVQCDIATPPAEPKRYFTIAKVKPGFTIRSSGMLFSTFAPIVVNSGYYAEVQLMIGGPERLVLEKQ